MKSALTTLLPFFAAAACVMLGGERLSRRTTEERTAVDRDRLMDFAELFRSEIEDLEERYLNHLERISGDFSNDQPEAADNANAITGIDAAQIFTARYPATAQPGKQEFILYPPSQISPKPPEIQIEGGDRPFNPNTAVILPSDLLYSKPVGSSGWIEVPGNEYRVHWSLPSPLHLVALSIRQSELEAVVDDYLRSEIPDQTTPLQETGEHVCVRNGEGIALITVGEEDRGPAAMILPFRTSLGEWQVQAWDRVALTHDRDPATLAVAGTLAGFMVLAGILLFVQQRRAMKLAEERVSFVNRVSHDLGTPLTNLALNADLATEALDSRPAETGRRLRIITEEIERLGRLVANVLTFSRHERRQLTLNPKPCSPDEEIDRVIASFRPSLERRNIVVERVSGASSRVCIDPDAFGQIIGNLISNVEKYASSGRLLRIESEWQDDFLTVRVRDKGPGIPAAARKRIFLPFERIHRKVNEGSSGTGLGLAIARELALRLEGSLQLLDCDTGCTFELRIRAIPSIRVVEDDNTSAA